MKLFNDCRKLKEKFCIKHLWMKGSNIFLRKEDNSRIFAIKSHFDIKQFENSFTNIDDQ